MLGEMQAVDWLAHWRQLRPGAVAVVDSDSGIQYTYRQLSERAEVAAAYLSQEHGIGPGDRVAFLAQNCLEHIDLLFACGILGAIYVPLNFRLAVPELSFAVDDARPKVALFTDEFETLARALDVKAGPPASRWVVVSELTRQGETDSDSLGGGRCERRQWPVDLDDPWAILYTGGTTGTPKGAVLSHRSITANAVNTIISWRLRPDDIGPIFTPFFHTGGWNVFTLPLLYLGGTVVLTRAFDPGRALNIIDLFGCTIVFMVPTMYQMMSELPGFSGDGLDTVRFFISGGAPCPLPLYQTYWDRGLEFKQGYGLTEAGPNTFALHGEEIRQKPGAVGRPLLYVEVRLVEEGGGEVTAAGEVGELWVRGPHVFNGYWNRPEATAAVLDQEGWLRTGDLARRDEEGCYYIVDRKKQVIISGGENIFPMEVETVLHSHPLVSSCAVFGVADQRWGEAVTAAVTLVPGALIAGDELRQYCRKRIAGYKVPKQVHIMEELPQTPAGKIDKKVLVALYSDRSECNDANA